MPYEDMIIVINDGKKTKEHVLRVLDIFLINERIDEVQYNDLINRINEKYLE